MAQPRISVQSVNARTPVSCSSTPTSVTIILDLSVQEVDATRMHPCDVVAEPEKKTHGAAVDLALTAIICEKRVQRWATSSDIQ